VRGRPSPAAVASVAPGLHRALLNRYGFDDLYDNLAGLVNRLGQATGWADHAVVDGLVNAVGRGTALAGLRGRRWQTGLVSTYVTTIIVGVALTLVFVTYVAPMLGWGR
jgi:NADH:ubiquinone oxidoreductase subunit 5 (subunit L)/multisubunit Na+/H+ antiporter MnhA subunit